MPARSHTPDEADVHAQGAVDAGAVDAQEDPVGNAGPARVLGAAVEARLEGQRDGRVGQSPRLAPRPLSQAPTPPP